MGKLLNRLNNQLKRPEHKKDAEKCLLIYNYLKNTTGYVWSKEWESLTNVEFLGSYPYKRHYYLNKLGDLVLKGLNNEK